MDKDIEEKLEYMRKTQDYNRVNIGWLMRTVEKQQKENEKMKQYIKNGIRWGYIDDREMEYKKFIE